MGSGTGVGLLVAGSELAMDVRRLVALLSVCHVAKSCCECVSECDVTVLVTL